MPLILSIIHPNVLETPVNGGNHLIITLMSSVLHYFFQLIQVILYDDKLTSQ